MEKRIRATIQLLCTTLLRATLCRAPQHMLNITKAFVPQVSFKEAVVLEETGHDAEFVFILSIFKASSVAFFSLLFS